MQTSCPVTLLQLVDIKESRLDTGFELQVSVKKVILSLVDLKRGESGVLEHLDVPEDEARRLMELGFVPGHVVTRAHAAPGGDPRVFQVDGSEVALRRETARRLMLRQPGSALKVN
jgi:Fe2+ transport system protein FeoA